MSPPTALTVATAAANATGLTTAAVPDSAAALTMAAEPDSAAALTMAAAPVQAPAVASPRLGTLSYARQARRPGNAHRLHAGLDAPAARPRPSPTVDDSPIMPPLAREPHCSSRNLKI